MLLWDPNDCSQQTYTKHSHKQAFGGHDMYLAEIGHVLSIQFDISIYNTVLEIFVTKSQ